MFPFRGYLFLSWRLTHRGGGRIFAVFWTSDAEKITIFWESSLWEKNCVFSAGPKLLLRTIPTKVIFLGNLLEYIFYHFSASWSCFFTVLFGLSTTSGGLCEKTEFFRVQKMTFFRVRKNGAFWLQRKAAGFVP